MKNLTGTLSKSIKKADAIIVTIPRHITLEGIGSKHRSIFSHNIQLINSLVILYNQ